MAPTLDQLRLMFPWLGFAVYAYEAGGPVTLEIHDDGQVETHVAPTLDAALLLAFPLIETKEPQAPRVPNLFD
jgi:hypothetical protein